MAANQNKVQCPSCKNLYDSNYLPIHAQACSPITAPFTPPTNSHKPRGGHNSRGNHHTPQAPAYPQYSAAYAVPQPVYQPMPNYSYPQQGYPPPQAYPVQSFPPQPYQPAWGTPSEGRVCHYCSQPFASRANDHLAQCPNAEQCRNCRDFCARGTIQQHLATKCRRGRAAP